MKLRRYLLLGAGMVISPFPHHAGAQSLEAVATAALEHSPQVAAADARADAASAQQDLAEAQSLPDLTAQGQIGVGTIDPKGFFGLESASTTPRVAQVTAEMPLLTFGRIEGGRDMARSGSKAAELAAQQTRLTLRVEVANAYSQAVAARRLVDSYDAMQKTLAEMERQAKLKFEAGAGTSTEVAQAAARLAEAEAGLAGAKGQLTRAMTELRTLSGLDVELDAVLPPPPPVPASREEAIADALTANPQLLAAEEMTRVAQGKARSARAEGLPMVGAYAEASAVRDQFFPGYTADTVSAGVRVKWNFFSFGRTGAKARVAESEVDAAEADLALARLRTEQAAITAFDSHNTAKLVAKAAEARHKAAKEALRGTELEVEVGEKPQLALLDAQREAIDAEAALASAQGQVIASAYMLRAITGME